VLWRRWAFGCARQGIARLSGLTGTAWRRLRELCRQAGLSFDAIFEAMSVGLVVGEPIVIPHLRPAVEFLDQLAVQQGEAASE